MRALLLAALLSRPASAAKLVEVPRAPDLAVPTLPAAVVPGPAAVAAASAEAAQTPPSFDGATLASWERLERSLLDALGSDSPSRAAQWREGVAHLARMMPDVERRWILEVNFAGAHGLDGIQGEKFKTLFRGEPTLKPTLNPQDKVSRVFSSGGRLFAAREPNNQLYERRKGRWDYLGADARWKPVQAEPKAAALARAKAAGLPDGALLAPSGGGKIGFKDSWIYLRDGSSWIGRHAGHFAVDAAVHGGLVYAATDVGVVTVVPEVSGGNWDAATEGAKAAVAPLEEAEWTAGDRDLWRTLEEAVKERFSLSASGFAPAWRAAAGAALREAPDAPLARTLGRALASISVVGPDRAQDVEVLLLGAHAIESLFPLIDRIEKAEGGLRIGDRDRGLEFLKNGESTVFSGRHDFLDIASGRFLAATEDGVWEQDGSESARIALKSHRVFKLIAGDKATYALTDKGLYELRPGRTSRAVVRGRLYDVLSDGDGWLLATERGLYELKDGVSRWVPESMGITFDTLRRTSQGVLAMSGGDAALIRQEGRWRRAPDLFRAARDFAEGAALSYLADAVGIRALVSLPPGWQELVAADLAALVESLSADAARAAASKAGPSLRDSRGRSLLGP